MLFKISFLCLFLRLFFTRSDFISLKYFVFLIIKINKTSMGNIMDILRENFDIKYKTNKNKIVKKCFINYFFNPTASPFC